MNTHYIVKCHDHKCMGPDYAGNKDADGGYSLQAENITGSLKAMEDGIATEHLTISIRSKDDNGRYFTILVIPLNRLSPGDEIPLCLPGLSKLIVE